MVGLLVGRSNRWSVGWSVGRIGRIGRSVGPVGPTDRSDSPIRPTDRSTYDIGGPAQPGNPGKLKNTVTNTEKIGFGHRRKIHGKIHRKIHRRTRETKKIPRGIPECTWSAGEIPEKYPAENPEALRKGKDIWGRPSAAPTKGGGRLRRPPPFVTNVFALSDCFRVL